MTHPPIEPDPPLGSWPIFYGVVLACAALVILLLVWFTACFHVPAE